MITAKGRLRHRFWGEYSALIALSFDTKEHCTTALPVLNEPRIAQWLQSPNEPRAVLTCVNSAELDKVKTHLAGFGADPDAIDSLAHSVDFGDPFTIEIHTLEA